MTNSNYKPVYTHLESLYDSIRKQVIEELKQGEEMHLAEEKALKPSDAKGRRTVNIQALLPDWPPYIYDVSRGYRKPPKCDECDEKGLKSIETPEGNILKYSCNCQKKDNIRYIITKYKLEAVVLGEEEISFKVIYAQDSKKTWINRDRVKFLSLDRISMSYPSNAKAGNTYYFANREDAKAYIEVLKEADEDRL